MTTSSWFVLGFPNIVVGQYTQNLSLIIIRSFHRVLLCFDGRTSLSVCGRLQALRFRHWGFAVQGIYDLGFRFGISDVRPPH